MYRNQEGTNFWDRGSIRLHCNHVTFKSGVVEESLGAAVDSIWILPDGTELHEDVAILEAVANLNVPPSRVLYWGALRGGQDPGAAPVMIVAHRQAGSFGVETIESKVGGWDAGHACHYLAQGVALGFSGGLVGRPSKGGWRAIGMLVARFNDPMAARSFVLSEEQIEAILEKAARPIRLPRLHKPRAARARTESPSNGPVEWVQLGADAVQSGFQNVSKAKQTVEQHVANSVDVARDLSRKVFGFSW
jgi:hypothetical protein